MQALKTDRQRAFVVALLEYGNANHTQAAIRAGFSEQSAGVTGYRLAHDPAIQEAIREEGQRRLGGAVIAAASFLVQTIGDEGAQRKDRLKAAEMLFNRTGLPAQSEHKVTVEHTMSQSEQLGAIKELATKLGLDYKSLVGDAIDVEFTEVPPGDTQTFGDDEW